MRAGLYGLLLGVLPLALRAEGLETWVARNGLITCRSQVTSANLNGVVYGAGRYVVWSDQWGDQGNLWSSADGSFWEAVAGPTAVNSVAFGNGRFLAVGGNRQSWESSDGVQWESREGLPMAWAARIVHGDTGFVVWGATGAGQPYLYHSVDGVSWSQTLGVSDLRALGYGNGRYVAATLSSPPPPGGPMQTTLWVGQAHNQSITWSRQPTIGEPLELCGLIHGAGRYVAVGRNSENGMARIAVSTDAQDWTVRELPGHERAWLQGIAYDNGQFVAVGDQGLILLSTDGSSWDDGPGPVPETLRGAAWGDHGWVVVGDGGVAYALGLSLDVPMLDRHLHGAVYAAGRYVVVGEGGTIGVSADGQDWAQPLTRSGKALLGVTQGNGQYVAVGVQGTVVTSADATAWTAQVSGSEAWLSAVAFGVGQYVAVGSEGVILGSTDGVTWEPRSSGTTNWLQAVAYGAGRFVAVGERSLLSSVDGVTWRAHPGLRDLNAVAYGDGLWVAAGGRAEQRGWTSSGMGVVYTSRDGELWERHKISSLPWLADVTYAGGWFVATVGGDFGGVLRSADGVRWEVLPLGDAQGLNAVASDGQTVVAVGDSGTIVQSGVVEPPDAEALTYDPLDHWHARAPYPTHHDLYRCVYGRGRFVAVGNRFERGGHGELLNSESSILSSVDGVHWERVWWDYRPEELLGLAYGPDGFVAVGDQGLILFSKDGRAWREVDSGTAEGLTDVAYGNDRYVAVSGGWWSGGRVVLNSPDGEHWQPYPVEFGGWQNAITFGGGRFLVGDAVSQGLLASMDGVTWTPTATNHVFSDLVFDGARFVGWGRDDAEAPTSLWVSPDGVDWTVIPTAGWVGLNEPGSYSLAYSQGRYVTFVPQNWDQGDFLVSPDGQQWDRLGLDWSAYRRLMGEERGALPPELSLAFGAGHYLVAAQLGQMARSRDGGVWTSVGLGPNVGLGPVVYGAGTFLALYDRWWSSWDQTRRSGACSTDGGLTWSAAAQPPELRARDLTFAHGLFVAVGERDKALGDGGYRTVGGVVICEPGEEWTAAAETECSLAGIAYGAGRFVAVGNCGEVLTSEDGRQWREVSSGADWELRDVAYGAPGFVAFGSWGPRVGFSVDGVSWTWREVMMEGEQRELWAAAWGNDRYVIVGVGSILVSYDGQTWEQVRSDAFGELSDVTFAHGRFVAIGSCGGLFSSVDGRTWRIHAAEVGMQLRGVTFGADSFVITGGCRAWASGLSSGLVLQSDPLIPTAPAVRMWEDVREVAPGEPFTLAAAASGSAPLSYQWFHGNNPVTGATESELTVTAAALGHAGSYLVEVSNAIGSVRGGPVQVQVSQPPEVHLRMVGGLGLRVAPAIVSFEAVASDPDGGVTAVEFYADGDLVVTDATAPFTCQSEHPVPGDYRWWARAIDSAGVSSYSEVVSLRVISPDPLVNWTVESGGFAAYAESIAYLGEKYLVRRWGHIGFSTDLSSWEVVTIPEMGSLRLVLYGEGWYVALAEGGESKTIWRSQDGRAWEVVPTTLDLRNIWMAAGAYGNGRFVMVGSGGDPQRAYVIRSTGADATVWVQQSLTGLSHLNAIAYGEGRFVSVGEQGRIAWSADAAQWQAVWSQTTSYLRGIAHGNGRFVAVGESGTILTSSNGGTWSVSESGTVEGLNAVEYGGEAFAAVGSNGTILKSLDGTHWAACLGGGRYGWSTVTWAEGRFVALGDGFMVRSDATTILDPLRLTPDGRLACGFAGVAGRNYRLERSEDLIEWAAAAAAAGVHGPMELVDPEVPNGPYRFYRVLWTP
jgi:hypothetical protein